MLEKHDKHVLIGFSASQLDIIDKAAARAGRKRAEFIRHSVHETALKIVGNDSAKGDGFDIIDWLFTPEQKARIKKMLIE